ncbi:6352_t:CDS:2 [Ambispora gerdemannii]|uniref:6352_t:CDS:1 n=1 Tax=Ambispora gerdemannii TaxID=144530 RepID=A0A9N9FJI4_9GLOM|nr:6352_t:CDS:2 [Ambispora gerdemannii]
MNVTSNSSHDIKTVNIVNDQDSAELAQPRLSHNTEIINNISQEQVQKSITNPTEDLTLVSEFVQGLLQEFSSPGTQLWESIEFCNLATASVSLQKLAHLFYQANTARKNSIKAKREEISSWGCYSERYEDKVIEVRSEDKNLTDKTARSRIYNEMRPYLTGISDGYLRVMTCKARKINKLFGYEYDPVTLKKINGIGWHMVNRVTCSADSISRLTNPQIRYIIDYVTSKTVNIVNDQSHVTSKTGDNQPHVTSKSEVSVSTTPIPSSQIFNSISSKKILESKVSMPSKSQASDSSGSITKISLPLISQPRKIRPYSARASYINTILKDHSYLSLRHSNPRSDSYAFDSLGAAGPVPQIASSDVIFNYDCFAIASSNTYLTEYQYIVHLFWRNDTTSFAKSYACTIPESLATQAWNAMRNDNIPDDKKFLGLTSRKVKNPQTRDQFNQWKAEKIAMYKKYNSPQMLSFFHNSKYEEYYIPYDWIGRKKNQLRDRFSKHLQQLEV